MQPSLTTVHEIRNEKQEYMETNNMLLRNQWVKDEIKEKILQIPQDKWQ